MTKAVLTWLAVLLVFSGAATIWSAWKLYEQRDQPQAELLETRAVKKPGADEDWLTRFTLTERNGESFSSSELDGQVHVTSFFFTTCPHYCTFQNQRVQELHDEFAEQGVRFVSITCDPQNDTPKRLREYADQLGIEDQSWVFLTGELPYIRRVAAEMYSVALDRQTHSESLLVVDGHGEVAGRFHWNKPEEVDEMKQLLAKLAEDPTGASVETAADQQVAAVDQGQDETRTEEAVEEQAEQEQPVAAPSE